jgi:hypothetical protein
MKSPAPVIALAIALCSLMARVEGFSTLPSLSSSRSTGAALGMASRTSSYSSLSRKAFASSGKSASFGKAQGALFAYDKLKQQPHGGK